MPLIVAELAEEVREPNRRFADAIRGLRTEFSGLRKELSGVREDVSELREDVVTTAKSLRWAIKIGTLRIACTLGILTFAYRVDQRATRTAEVVVA